MERVASLSERTKPGPPKESETTKLLKGVKPFQAIDINCNPWTLPRLHQDVIPITYGNIYVIARALVSNMTPDERYLALQERRLTRFFDGRAFRIRLQVKDGRITLGGKIWLRDSKGRSAEVQDVKGLFQANWLPISKLYGTNDLPTIMERTRNSLAQVGLRADQQDWYRCSSITNHLWRKMKVNLNRVPAVQTRRREPGNLQGYNVFGHREGPVYFYDIHSAYLSVMREFDELKPFVDRIWAARQELKQASDPAEQILKIAAVVMPGKFSSTLPGNRFYRPVLGKYIRQRINDRLRNAMELIDDYYDRYRWCVDGFISPQDISNHLDIGDNIGQWKPIERHERLTIAQTNIWWTNGAHKDNGYLVKEAQVLNDPEEIHTSRTVFDWNTLEEREEPVTIHQNHYEEECRACSGAGGDLHDTLPKGIIL
jgi:hypothetical protein